MTEQEFIRLSNGSYFRPSWHMSYSHYELFITQSGYSTKLYLVYIWDIKNGRYVFPTVESPFKDQSWTVHFKSGPHNNGAELDITAVVETINFFERLQKLNAFEN